MKYVIFKTEHHSHIMYEPVIFPEHVVHSTIKIESQEGLIKHEIHSAGFFYLKQGHVIVEERGSESLNIGPDLVNDQKILTFVLINAGTTFFIQYK